MAVSKPRTSRKPEPVAAPKEEMVFSMYNYKLILAGVALIVAGFTAMAIEDQWNGFISLYVSPILIVAGFAELVWAIMAEEPRSGTPTS